MIRIIQITFSFIVLFVNISDALANPVTLKGNCNVSGITHVKIVSYSPFWREGQQNIWDEAEKEEDNTFSLSFETEESTQLYFMILGYTWSIYVTPDDTIEFNIFDEGEHLFIVFEGKNAPHYNYDPQLQKLIRRKDRLYYKKFDDPEIYRLEVKKRYKKEKEFFQQYLKTHLLNKDFIKYAQSQYTYEYIQNLYAPLVNEEVKCNDLPKYYFEDIKNVSFQDSQLLSFTKFRYAIRAKYIFGYNNDPWNSFEEVYNNILLSFTGKVRDFLIADMIGIYAKKEKQNYRNSLLKVIKEAKDNIKDSEYLDYIKKSELLYKILNKPFPADVLKNTYLRSTTDEAQISLQSLLESFKGKAIYIDFWASWCSPCIYDIENSKETKEFLANHNVVYLYLSLDKSKDIEKWELIAKKKGILEKQYIVTDDFSSRLVKSLDITQIPRYVILGKEHTIKTYNASRPTPPHLDELKIQVKEAITEVFKYN